MSWAEQEYLEYGGHCDKMKIQCSVMSSDIKAELGTQWYNCNLNHWNSLGNYASVQYTIAVLVENNS